VTSLESLALRVLLPSFPGTTLSADVLRLLEEGLGGLCLFGSNTSDGPDAVSAYAARVRSASPVAVVAVDEEGGDVTRLHVPDGSPVLGPLALGAAGDLALTRAVGRAIGLELAAVGITLDLGPVADVSSNPRNPVIGTRSFGSSASDAAAHVAAWTLGLQSAGVAACAKHFPGHGDTAEDSHLSLPVLDVDLPELIARELVPFAAAIEAGAAAVMTSHVVVPALDPELPATLSPAILGLLRDRLGFTGVIVSDALDMAGASATRGIPAAAVLSIAAGADLLCLGAGN
jgi:beta-N-acetylhexosaminidase